MEQPDRSLHGSAPDARRRLGHVMEGLDRVLNHRVPFRIRSLQQPIERMPAQRRRWVERLRALQRHSIWKITLVDTLFNLLDLLNVGALGRHELVQFALLTGFQGDRGTLHDQVSHLLDAWGSTHGSRFFTNKTSMLDFRQIVSRTGPLAMVKAELRRTIRYAKPIGSTRTHPLARPQARADPKGGHTVETRNRLAPLRLRFAPLPNSKLCGDPNRPLKTRSVLPRGTQTRENRTVELR